MGLIHHQSLRLHTGPYRDTGVLTLMITDVDELESASEMFHEIWAQLFVVVVGTYLLTRQIGWFSPIPIDIIFCK